MSTSMTGTERKFEGGDVRVGGKHCAVLLRVRWKPSSDLLSKGEILVRVAFSLHVGRSGEWMEGGY